ncbi:hypothetical protein F9C07_1805054 [Aspergillus flavus]|uniref:Uncharacterized protein n=1 Tax=Aspergillus flavus (strain ATCC 200026 / FGSC A1120 / IAM 13836 / NRRL 3357 / JCM 12722 / SRRC 167) TaxID=332952 RepID=A0A7U2N2P7_ASPFN|nr:hypothetical protein F9C07_1805054 [Aspergillus flavus]
MNESINQSYLQTYTHLPTKKPSKRQNRKNNPPNPKLEKRKRKKKKDKPGTKRHANQKAKKILQDAYTKRTKKVRRDPVSSLISPLSSSIACAGCVCVPVSTIGEAVDGPMVHPNERGIHRDDIRCGDPDSTFRLGLKYWVSVGMQRKKREKICRCMLDVVFVFFCFPLFQLLWNQEI